MKAIRIPLFFSPFRLFSPPIYPPNRPNQDHVSFLFLFRLILDLNIYEWEYRLRGKARGERETSILKIRGVGNKIALQHRREKEKGAYTVTGVHQQGAEEARRVAGQRRQLPADYVLIRFSESRAVRRTNGRTDGRTQGVEGGGRGGV